MTVFLGMTVIMIISIFFSLIEVVHVNGITKHITLSSDLGIQRSFADYNRLLWEKYSILGMDLGYGGSEMNQSLAETKMAEYVNDNCNTEGLSFYRSKLSECQIEEYGLLSDNNGMPLIKEAVKSILYDIPDIAIDEITGIGSSVSSDMERGANIDQIINEADESLKNASLPDANAPSGTEPIQPAPTMENPVDAIRSFKSSGVLAQVVSPELAISDRALSVSDIPSRRHLNTGNYSDGPHVGISDKAMFGVYLEKKLSNFRTELSHPGLSYEWEYVLCRKDTDRENLEAIVKRLLAMREVENFAAIVADGVKMAEAESVAVAVAGWSVNPAVIEAVKWGIIAAWAYVESVLDIRLLLHGGKVSVLKSPAEWTSQIMAIGSYLDVNVKARDCAAGLRYEGYLMVLTQMKTFDELGRATLDLFENALRSTPDYVNIRIDNLAFAIKANHSYEARPVFLSAVPSLNKTGLIYQYRRTPQLSYL